MLLPFQIVLSATTQSIQLEKFVHLRIRTNESFAQQATFMTRAAVQQSQLP